MTNSLRDRQALWKYGATLARVISVVALLLTASVSSGTYMAGLVRAQVAGATLTVLRGSVGVLQANGTPVSPAASGLTLASGDRVATIGRSSALVTFFDGSEIELGADTTIVLRELADQAGRRTITIESVIGTTLHRVVTVVDSGSSYRVESGGSVALVRGTVFAHHVDASGDVSLAVSEGEMEFPRPGLVLRRGEKRTLTSRGDIVDGRFDPSMSLFTVVTEPTTSGNPSGTENPGIGTGSQLAPQQQSAVQQREEDSQEHRQVSLAGRTFLIAPAPSGTVRLEVASVDGFAVRDPVRIGTGSASEVGTIVGFGSIILQQPLAGSFGVGTLVERIPDGAPTVTTVPTAGPTLTLGVIGSVVPSPAATSSLTPTVSPTASTQATAVPTQTVTLSATGTVTATQSATLPPSATATPKGTPTATQTPTPTATITMTATPTTSPTATSTPTATAVFPCLGPLTRERAVRGSGTVGATRRTVPSGVSVDLYVELLDAAPITTFDVWIDVAGGAAGEHRFVGTFTTDGAGHAVFTGMLVKPSVGALIDTEITLSGENPSLHQYIRELFAPCST